MAKKDQMTPLMQQYWGVKSAHPDKVILFRMGDFFEMFHDDALISAPLLGITLTVRNKKSGDQTPMCGVPHHSIGGHINRLLQAGKKVAICDQVEDPKFAKGLVKREITRILTPGMVYDVDTLEGHQPHYLCSYDLESLSFMDSTTGECFFYQITDLKKKSQLIETLSPVEIVIADFQTDEFENIKPKTFKGVVSIHDDLASRTDQLPSSALRLYSYAQSMQGESALKTLKSFELRDSDFRLQISANVFRHLEIFKTYKGDKEGTLFAAIDRTKTAGGSRRLKNWLLFPLTDLKKIELRQNEVEYWSKDLEVLKDLRKKLFQVGDLERRLSKITQPQCHPRDIESLNLSLISALELVPLMRNSKKLEGVSEIIKKITDKVGLAFVDEIPNNYRDGAFIRLGFHSILDEFIVLATDSQKRVRKLEEKEKELTGISSLKIRYNNVFGFYIEVTNTHKNKVPQDRYQRKQTLTNAERYVTDELVELEKKVVTAKTKRVELELEILSQLKQDILSHIDSILILSEECNQMDVFTSLAWLALEHNYVKPQICEEGDFLIEGSRHPVIEQFVQNNFIANDILIKKNQCLLLTGPNMAGKSTIMRQVAIASLLAQVGSFIPARKARLPIVDKIFTRIGASDFLTEGLSTFMVEMQETAEMLSEATERSLVILDEVGRGTSTYDGLSLAQSILEYFLQTLKSYTLFATHYHELTKLEDVFPERLLNKHMSILESKGEILFRYHLTEGPAQKSYGIQVAKLAGLPQPVIQKALQILNILESGENQKNILKVRSESDSLLISGLKQQKNVVQDQSHQMDLWQNIEKAEKDQEIQEFLQSIKKLEIQKLTPLDALNKLAQWQQELS